MTRSQRSILYLVIALVAGIGVVEWLATDRLTWIDWLLRITMPVLAIGLLSLLLINPRRREKIPDFLGEKCKDYFGRNGFCFTFVPAVTDGVLWIQLYYQNQYAGRCRANVMLRPPKGRLGLKRVAIDRLEFEIDADGAEFGVAAVPLGIPEDLQGKALRFDVGCDVKYVKRRGNRLRHYEGAPVGGTRDVYGINVLAFLIGHLAVQRSAYQTIQIPSGILSVIPADLMPQTKSLWLPDADAEGAKI